MNNHSPASEPDDPTCHPPIHHEQLLHELARRIQPSDPDALIAELRQEPTFQGDLTWLGQMFAVAEPVRAVDVPADLHDRLLNTPMT